MAPAVVDSVLLLGIANFCLTTDDPSVVKRLTLPEHQYVDFIIILVLALNCYFQRVQHTNEPLESSNVEAWFGRFAWRMKQSVHVEMNKMSSTATKW